MITRSLHQGGDFLSDRVSLFETESKPSRALTILNRILFGIGAMILTVAPFIYWIHLASMPVDEFEIDFCGYSSPTLEELALRLLFINMFAALFGVLFYLTRNSVSKITHHKERHQRKPMKVVLWRESNPLSKVKVAAPCTAEWRLMYGNDRVRFCNQCQLNVYNLSAMTKWEAEDLIRNSEGRLCVRFYRRADGTILTENCPVGLRAFKKKLSHFSAATISAMLTFLANVGLLWWIDKNSIQQGVFSVFIAKPNETNLHVTTGVIVRPESFVDQPPVKREESFIREKALFKVSPVYQAIGSRRVKGDAVVKVIISEDGDVENAELIKGHPLLKELAEEAASRWKFEPMFSHDLPANIESHLTFRFR